MIVGIMQPYFLPYIGYWQLMNYVDVFVIYDEIKYVKGSWINRNRILRGNSPEYMSPPLKKDSDYLNINQRFLADDWLSTRKKLLNNINIAYHSSPYFKSIFPLLEEAIAKDERSLFRALENSLRLVRDFLNITTPLVISSSLELDKSLNGADMVVNICEVLGGDTYLNPIGGRALYQNKLFMKSGIELGFLQSRLTPYFQNSTNFIHSLSIVDIMMNNSIDTLMKILHSDYDVLAATEI